MSILKKNSISALKIAGAYIGLVVGAGFATGQELMQFFVAYGIHGLWGIILSTVLFIIFGFIIMNLGDELKAKSHLDILKSSNGKILGITMDLLITICLFGSFTAMIAGTGALFTQQFGLSGITGSLLMAVITALTVLTGIHGVINSISIVVPFLLTSVIGICLFSISKIPAGADPGIVITKSGLVNNWVLSAILYTSYNTVISIAVLGPLGACAKNKKSILNGAILGGLGLGLSSALIYLAISANLANIKDLEVPMSYIAENISYTVHIIFTFVLVAEIYTTAVGSLYGFTARLLDMEKSPLIGRITIVATSIAAFIASLIGFSNLVKYLYPLVGYGGILLLISLLLKYGIYKKKRTHQRRD